MWTKRLRFSTKLTAAQGTTTKQMNKTYQLKKQKTHCWPTSFNFQSWNRYTNHCNCFALFILCKKL